MWDGVIDFIPAKPWWWAKLQARNREVRKPLSFLKPLMWRPNKQGDGGTQPSSKGPVLTCFQRNEQSGSKELMLMMMIRDAVILLSVLWHCALKIWGVIMQWSNRSISHFFSYMSATFWDTKHNLTCFSYSNQHTLASLYQNASTLRNSSSYSTALGKFVAFPALERSTDKWIDVNV